MKKVSEIKRRHQFLDAIYAAKYTVIALIVSFWLGVIVATVGTMWGLN